MSRRVFLDCFAGLSGDMFLGALCDLRAELFPDLREKMLPLAGTTPCKIEAGRVNRAYLSAAKIVIEVGATHQHHRSLREILAKIESAAQLSVRVRELGARAFQNLFEAEALVHGSEPETVHLHEAGSIDALIDILGTFHLLERLGVTSLSCSPLNIGAGFVECSHGTYPVPAPATAFLLRGMPTYSAGPAFERVTPTGAAILKTLAPAFVATPPFVYDSIGHGAGDKDSAGFPNVLRAFLGDDDLPEVTGEKVIAIEATVDDMEGQVAGYFLERALAAGAVDVYFTPIFMKKNRPAVKLTCLCPRPALPAVARLFFEESTTIGLRFVEMDRLTLDREIRTVETRWGQVRIKIGKLGGEIVNYHPEYEDCAAIAREARVPLKKVQAEAVAAFLKL